MDRQHPPGLGELLRYAHWQTTFSAIEVLETEIGHPLRRVLPDALEREGFAARLEAAARKQAGVRAHVG